ncbi:hypothetical protein M413DRAFT_22164 [Hebeloma cylindrosporum]|uniref:Ribonuclease T2-like n=1 Tax=Hebeloma cylindrosporum TaxID=76867 RepID=A0A0C3CFJ7_HEBCY|nr:hypothetical protein M413DRAFT_22164 [Hebeloma cylindrosporum h7]
MLLDLLLSLICGGLALATPPFLDVTEGSQIFEQLPSISSACSRSGQQSCHNTTIVENLCCFESPGGLLLQTQFWDTNPSTGPSNSWTIHGLWPDNCDTTFKQNCDPSRAYTGIGNLLAANGASDTLAFMKTNWVDIKGQNEHFWEHEWSTHGTCLSTLVPSCLPSGSVRGAEAVAFFQTVVKLFQTLPTYTWLENAGITPSTSRTFTLAQFTSALKAQSPTEVPGTLPAKATVHALQSGSSIGGLLSTGTWSTQTLATFRLSGTASSFTMTSSRGNCGVSAGSFSCGSGVSLTTFSAVSSGGNLLLSFGGSTAFSSDGVPSGASAVTVFTGSKHSQDYTLSLV